MYRLKWWKRTWLVTNIAGGDDTERGRQLKQSISQKLNRSMWEWDFLNPALSSISKNWSKTTLPLLIQKEVHCDCANPSFTPSASLKQYYIIILYHMFPMILEVQLPKPASSVTVEIKTSATFFRKRYSSLNIWWKNASYLKVIRVHTER